MTKPGDDLTAGLEQVFIVFDYWDQPQSGVASFQGRPHFYGRIFDEIADDYSDLYRLTPLSEEAFQAALENWKIFLRWQAAFDAGTADRETHPSLPSDRKRYDETKNIVSQALQSRQGEALEVPGSFTAVVQGPMGALCEWQVRWSIP